MLCCTKYTFILVMGQTVRNSNSLWQKFELNYLVFGTVRKSNFKNICRTEQSGHIVRILQLNVYSVIVNYYQWGLPIYNLP